MKMTPEQYNEAAKKYREGNEKRLDSCAYHEFVVVHVDEYNRPFIYECQNCRGRLVNTYVDWYNLGKKHQHERL